MSKEKKFKWTAIFLIRGAAGNSNDLMQMLHQVARATITDEIGVILCINIIREAAPSLLPVPGGLADGRTGWSTLFYALEPRPEGGALFKLIGEKADFRMGEEEDISGFFKDNVLSSFAAERYVLFTWDHGQPFGIFPGNNAPPALVKSAEDEIYPEMLYFRLAAQLKKERGGLEPSGDDALPILTITELKQAIVWAFGDKTIDVVVMANCFLQFFDTGYELSSCVDYLVAFETEMYFRDAYDYKVILEVMARDPQLTPESLAKIIVSSFAMQRNENNFWSKNSVALFANDLSWYPVLARLIDDLAGELIRELPRHRAGIQAAIDKCAYLSPGIPAFSLVDFRNFIRCLYAGVPSLFSGIPYEYFERTLDRAVVGSFIGNSLMDESKAAFKAPSCFSVYLPKESDDYQSSFLDNFMKESALAPTEFIKRFRWESFVKELYT